MKGLQCLGNSRQALYRVFISPTERPDAAIRLGRQLQPLLQRLPMMPMGPARIPPGQFRSYAKSTRKGKQGESVTEAVALDLDRNYDKRYTTQRDLDRSGRSRPPQDHEITDPRIMVVDNGVVEGPLSTSFVMTKITAGESLRMVQPYVPANRKEGRPETFATCKIVNKKDEFERMEKLKENRKAAGNAKPKSKELEVTWAIGEHDLGTKMRRLGGFLEKGMKVDVMIARKKKGRQAAMDEAEAVVARVREVALEKGGREVKVATGNVGGTMRLYLEGIVKKAPAAPAAASAETPPAETSPAR